MSVIRTILKSSADADGRYPVLLMLSDRGKRAYFTTGFTATKELFDNSKDGGRFLQGRGVKSFNVERKEEDGSFKSYTNKEANDALADMERRAGEILRGYNHEHREWSLDMFRQDFLNIPRREFFLTYAQSVIEREYRAQDRFQKARIAEGALESLKAYDKDLDKRAMVDITIPYLQGYIKHCQSIGNTNNTIGIRLREIRRIFNIAIREKVIPAEIYPFSNGREDGKVKLPKAELSKTDQYISLDNIKKLASTPLDNFVLERTRRLFLFSYYCKGINWKDMALLTNKNFYKLALPNPKTQKTEEFTVLQYKRAKTKGAFDIKVTPYIQEELDWFRKNTPLYEDNVLPIISCKVKPESLDEYLQQVRKRFNHSLKEVAKALGFPESQQNISIYTARHSYAMTLQDKGKAIEHISQALGHASVKTTKHYLAKFDILTMAKETDIDLFEDEPKKEIRKDMRRKRPSKADMKP